MSLRVTDTEGAASFAEKVEALSSAEFALLTSLRTGIATPAYFWPSDTQLEDDRLEIRLARQTIANGETATRSRLAESEALEAVGTTLTFFEYTGAAPASLAVVFPSGETIQPGGIE